MEQLVTGTINGKTIVFNEPLGIPDGEPVQVVIRPLPGKRSPGDGIRNSAGVLAFEFTDEDQRILDEIQAARHCSDQREIEP
ncbi:MAG TPA: hypothetical protein VGI40_10610 [Pirellulaceae bacterium]